MRIEYHRGVLVGTTSAVAFFVIAVLNDLIIFSVASNEVFVQVPNSSYFPQQLVLERLILTVIFAFSQFTFRKKGNQFIIILEDETLLPANSSWTTRGFVCALSIALLSSHVIPGVANLGDSVHSLTGKLFNRKGVVMHGVDALHKIYLAVVFSKQLLSDRFQLKQSYQSNQPHSHERTSWGLRWTIVHNNHKMFLELFSP